MENNPNKNAKLQIVTITLPRSFLAHIELLVREGMISSRSEYIRHAVHEALLRDDLLMSRLHEEIPLSTVAIPDDTVFVDNHLFHIIHK